MSEFKHFQLRLDASTSRELGYGAYVGWGVNDGRCSQIHGCNIQRANLRTQRQNMCDPLSRMRERRARAAAFRIFGIGNEPRAGSCRQIDDQIDVAAPDPSYHLFVK